MAGILLPSRRIDVIVAGGMLRRADGGIVGEQAVDFMSQFKVDYAVIGVSAIDDDGSLLDFDYREVRVAQAIITNARNVILVADSMKFTAPPRCGSAICREINIFVTDRRAAGDASARSAGHSGTTRSPSRRAHPCWKNPSPPNGLAVLSASAKCANPDLFISCVL